MTTVSLIAAAFLISGQAVFALDPQAAPPLPEPLWTQWTNCDLDLSTRGVTVQNLFNQTRDESCPGRGESCLAGLNSLTGQFAGLTQAIIRFYAMTETLRQDPVLGRLSNDDKRTLRRGYARALKNTVVWVHGLDNLLNMAWGDPATRRRLDRIQDRLAKEIEIYAQSRNAFTMQTKDLIAPWPVPNSPPADDLPGP